MSTQDSGGNSTNKVEHITVAYLSPIGGTRKACLSLVMEMEKKVRDMDLCSLEREYPFGPGDAMIVGVPAFGGRIPGCAAEKFTYLRGSGAAIVTTTVYGNRAFEDILPELDDCLKTQRFRIGAETTLLAEHSMVRDVAAGRSDGRDQKEMADFAVKTLEKLEGDGWQEPQVSRNRPYRDWKQIPVIPLTNISRISYGLCAARYSAQAIPVSSPSSTDQSHCILYMRCISVCPMKARSLPGQVCTMPEQKLSSVRGIRRENELFL